MQKIEYKVEKISAKGLWSSKIEVDEMENVLNTLGEQGWDLITAFDTSKYDGATSGAYLVFKRPVH